MRCFLVDFDGTLVRVNSFPLWIKFCLRKSFLEFRYFLLAKIFFLLFLRKFFNLISHEVFKAKLDSFCYPPGWVHDFVSCLYEKNRVDLVLDRINQLGSDCDMVLITTAAPSCYAKEISGFFYFNNINTKVVSSYCSSDGVYFDNYRGNKLTRIREILDFDSISNFVLFTDSPDDLHLAEISSTIFLCNPTDKSLEEFSGHNLKVEVLRG